MINKSITENNKKRPIIGRLICRNNQKQIPLASESKNEMEKGTILIVDDNKGVLASLELLLETEFSEIKTAHHPNQIISIINTSPIDVIILDMNFSAGINNGNEGLYWLKRIREIAPALPVVMLTAYGDVELAVKALKNDATDFLLKPWDNRTLVRKIKDAFGSGKKRKNRIPDRNKSPMIVGTSPAMQQLMKIVVKVARTDANILITGENGTGKENGENQGKQKKNNGNPEKDEKGKERFY